MNRRGFLVGAAGACLIGRWAESAAGAGSNSDEVNEEFTHFLYRNLHMTDAEIDAFAVGKVPGLRAQFDPELGYIEITGRTRDGLDGTISTYTYDGGGARIMRTYAELPCRINTYGNSFTECAQVSDGETWQERLAARLGEPVRNFGVGGYSVYQAYRRMRQKEAVLPAPCIIFNIYSEDHTRNLNPASSSLSGGDRPGPPLGIRPFISANAATRSFAMHPNPCPVPAALRNLSDPAWLWRTFGTEDYVRLLFLRAEAERRPSEIYHPMVREIASRRSYAKSIDSPESQLAAIGEMETSDALFSTMALIERILAFAAERSKRVFFVLSQSDSRICDVLNGKKRFDQPLVDFLRARNVPFLDMLEAHRRDFRNFKLQPRQYTSRFYVAFGRGFGHDHYNPMGNEFQALALADPMAEFLDPKPAAYRFLR